MINLNPELIIIRDEKPVTMEQLAREYEAKHIINYHYSDKARRLGMTLEGYCKRFNVKLY